MQLRRDYDYSEAGQDTSLVQTMEEFVAGDRDHTTTYDYDRINRLTEAVTKDPAGTVEAEFAYAYDPNGNLTRATEGGTTTHLSYLAGNELACTWTGAASPECPTLGSTTYGYDDAGNLTSSSEGLSISYNAKGQTTSVTPPAGTPTEMDYLDATQDRRVEKGQTGFLHTQLGEAYQAEPLQTTYFVRDPEGGLLYQRGSGGRHYYVLDHLRSVIASVDGGGNPHHQGVRALRGGLSRRGHPGAVGVRLRVHRRLPHDLDEQVRDPVLRAGGGDAVDPARSGEGRADPAADAEPVPLCREQSGELR